MPGLAPAQIVPTVGLNLARLEVPAARGGAETCVFWDLGGAPGLRGIWERYYAECDGVLFVVDAALSAENTAAENTDDGEDDRSKDAVTDEQIALLRRVLAEPRLAGAPALVLVNKADAVSTARAERMARACASALEAAGTQRHRVEQTVGTVGRGWTGAWTGWWAPPRAASALERRLAAAPRAMTRRARDGIVRRLYRPERGFRSSFFADRSSRRSHVTPLIFWRGRPPGPLPSRRTPRFSAYRRAPRLCIPPGQSP